MKQLSDLPPSAPRPLKWSQGARFWHATRPQFLTASAMPVLVGTSWGAAAQGSLDFVSALVFLIGVVLGHAAGNVINDVCDDISGNDPLNEDRIWPFTGGSRTIQEQILSRRTMAQFAFLLMCGCAATALYLVPVHGTTLLVFGITMGVIVLAYHLPPLQLNYRGMAETLVALMFGIFPVSIAAWLQSGTIDLSIVLISLPISLWVANILLINEIPDLKADAAVNKTTLAVLLGARGALKAHALITLAALGVTTWIIFGVRLVPWWAMLLPALLSILVMAIAIRTDPNDREAMTKAIKATLALHALGSLCLMVSAWVK